MQFRPPHSKELIHSLALFLKILCDSERQAKSSHSDLKFIVGSGHSNQIGFEVQVETFAFAVVPSSILMIKFFYFLFLFIVEFLLVFVHIISIFEEISCIFYCQVLTLVDLYMAVPFLYCS